MRLTRSSSQTTGARTLSDQVISPQLRKSPPSVNSSTTTPSKRTRRSATSTTSSEQSDSSPKPPIHSHGHLEPKANETADPFTRKQGARKSRQNVQIKHQTSSTLTAILKDSSVTTNSTRGKPQSNSNVSNGKSNNNNNNNNNNCNRLALRVKKKPITKDHPDGTGSQQLFDVEDIMDVKLQKGRYYYLIKWKGYSESDNTWEPEEHLPSDLLDFYFKKSNARTKNEASSVTRDSNNCDLGNVNRENTSTSSHSRVTINQGTRCKGTTVVPPVRNKTGRLTINCPSPESASSSYESDSFLLASCPRPDLHESSNVADHTDESNDCLPCSSFQANSPPESNGGIDIDLPKSGGPSIDVQQESSSNVYPNHYDVLSLCNLKKVVIGKSSAVSSQYSNFELNDSLVPGKVVCIDKSPFGTGKMVLIKWIDHEPTTWIDYDFVKLKYPELLADFYEEILVIDSLPQ